MTVKRKLYDELLTELEGATTEQIVQYMCNYLDSADLSTFLEFIKEEKQG